MVFLCALWGLQQVVIKPDVVKADPSDNVYLATALAGGAGPKRVLITLGYSGWQAGQLEDELGRNGWLTVDADPAVIFDTPIEQRYDRALSLLGFDPRMLSQEAGHA